MMTSSQYDPKTPKPLADDKTQNLDTYKDDQKPSDRPHTAEEEAAIAAYWKENPLDSEDDKPITTDIKKSGNDIARQTTDAKTPASNDSAPHDFPITTRERNYWRFAAGAGAGLGLGSITVNLWWWLSSPTGAGAAGAGLTASTTAAALAFTGVLGLGIAVGGYFAYKAYKDFVQQAEDLNKQINLEKAAHEKEQNELLDLQIDLIRSLLILRNQCRDYNEFVRAYTPNETYKDLKETINKSSLSAEEKTALWNTHTAQFSALSVLIESKYNELKQSNSNTSFDEQVKKLNVDQLKNLASVLPQPPKLKSIQAIETEVNTTQSNRDASNLAFRNYALGSFVGIFCTTWGIAAVVTGLTLTFSIPIVGWIAGLATVSILGAYAIGRLAERYSIKNALRKTQLEDIQDKKSQVKQMRIDTLKATGHIKVQGLNQLQTQVKLLKSQSSQPQLTVAKSPANEDQFTAELQQQNQDMAIQIAKQRETERDLRLLIEQQAKKLNALTGTPKEKAFDQPPAHAPHSPQSDVTILKTLSSITGAGNQPTSPKQVSSVQEKTASNETGIDAGMKRNQSSG